MSHEILFFGGFLLFIILMLAIDLGLFSKSNKPVSFRQAAIMSAIWVTFALGFYVVLRIWGYELHDIQDFDRLTEITKRHLHNIRLIPGDFEASLALYNKNLALEYITGYVVEYALSVDNIFVMVLIFTSFGVPAQYYHKVLVWGIIGAIVLRFLFIFLGAALISQFGWILYLFGFFLVYTGINMFLHRSEEEEIDPKNHKVVKFASRYFSVYPTFVGGKFFHRENGKKYITPLFLVLLVIEFTDLIFAVDSIPAIFAVTKDPYIVFFSNIFAILGLRSMFFLLVNIIHKFHYLKTGLSFLLVFIGAKMLLHHWLDDWGFTTSHSLIIIISILAVSVVASLIFPKKEKQHPKNEAGKNAF
ncbi:tellurite resistance protein TerC [Parapedobacter luteus]|uniref:Tellurite resistance protein TerC n=1 Tax=Parapedobacter luteus TaxID=623280 RepID=A0A1T5DMK0_9SPHI|nr:TerC family protein [Parapedobacter luteus]SKB72927.1 tellurite resistance protein TerC [Parapedobacter luteus]